MMLRDPSSGVHQAARARSSVPAMSRARSATFLVRVFMLASVAVVASVWALVRFYTHVRPPMLVPATAQETWDAGAGMMLAPEIEVERR
jgi:hypothetical protein